MGIPGAIIGIIALFMTFQAIGQSRKVARYKELADGKAKPTTADIPMLLDFLEQKPVSEQAGRLLEKIEGGDSQITARLNTAKEPWAKKNLASAIGRRGTPDTANGLKRLLDRATESDVRKSIWEALARVATSTDTDDFIGKLRDAPAEEARDIESAIVSATRKDPNVDARGMNVRSAYLTKSAGDEGQAALLRAMCRIGNKSALDDIKKALKDEKNEKLRDAAAYALTEWPNAAPIGALLELLAVEKDQFVRRKAVTSVGALASYAGDTPQSSIAESLAGLYAKTKDTKEQAEILLALARVTDPAAVKFFQDLATSTPRLQRQCNDAVKSINDALAKAVTLAAGANTLSAAQAILSPGPLSLSEGVIINWLSTNDTVGWLVKIDKPGAFEVELSQSSATPSGHYSVTFGAETWSRSVEATGAATVFKTATIGRAKFDKPGIYRLLIKPLDIPKDGQLMRLKGATVIGAAN
jgi:HEAT repeat protein